MVARFLLVVALAYLGFVGPVMAQCPLCGGLHRPYSEQGVCTDALAEVNAARAKKGLRPFLRDDLLTQGALACAKARAAQRIEGHLPNDFSLLPPGAHADSAGCGALEPSWGWGTCCTYENYTYAGAAWVMRDGKRFMHVFVRH